MVGAFERDDAVLRVAEVLAGVGAGEFERALDGFGAAGGVEDAFKAGQFAEALGEFAGVLVRILRREMDEGRGLIGHGGDHTRVGVAERVDAEAGHEVQVAIAGCVPEVDAVAALHDDGVAGVDGE